MSNDDEYLRAMKLFRGAFASRSREAFVDAAGEREGDSSAPPQSQPLGSHSGSSQWMASLMRRVRHLPPREDPLERIVFRGARVALAGAFGFLVVASYSGFDPASALTEMSIESANAEGSDLL